MNAIQNDSDAKNGNLSNVHIRVICKPKNNNIQNDEALNNNYDESNF